MGPANTTPQALALVVEGTYSLSPSSDKAQEAASTATALATGRLVLDSAEWSRLLTDVTNQCRSDSEFLAYLLAAMSLVTATTTALASNYDTADAAEILAKLAQRCRATGQTI